MTNAEFQKLTGKSPTQARKLIAKGEFSVPGYGKFRAVKPPRKRGVAGRYIITKIGDPDPVILAPGAAAERNGRLQDLKAAKAEAELRLLELKLSDTRAKIEKNFQQDVLELLYATLEPLKQAFRKCNLSKSQVESVNAALDASLKRLQAHLIT